MSPRLSLLLLSAVLVIGAALVWQRFAPASAPSAASVRAPRISAHAEVLGVDRFMRNVNPHSKETVIVEGVVSAVVPEEHALTLIDVAERERCGVVTCAALSLPVRWDGSMPAVVDQVRIRGKLKSVGEKLVVVASELETTIPATESSN